MTSEVLISGVQSFAHIFPGRSEVPRAEALAGRRRKGGALGRVDDVSLSLSVSLSLYLSIYLSLSLYISLSVPLSLYIYIYTHMCIYIYIYIYTHDELAWIVLVYGLCCMDCACVWFMYGLACVIYGLCVRLSRWLKSHATMPLLWAFSLAPARTDPGPTDIGTG